MLADLLILGKANNPPPKLPCRRIRILAGVSIALPNLAFMVMNQ